MKTSLKGVLVALNSKILQNLVIPMQVGNIVSSGIVAHRLGVRLSRIFIILSQSQIVFRVCVLFYQTFNVTLKLSSGSKVFKSIVCFAQADKTI